MFVIFRYDIKNDTEFIYNIVENHDILVSYIQELMTKYSDLKSIQNPPHNPHIGYTIPLLRNEEFEFWVQRHEFVTKPTFD
jgi:hypothetical protein